MRVDFCLPVKNEEKILKANTEKLVHFLQTNNLGIDWQVAIMVNGSNDDSYQIAQSLQSDRVKAKKLPLPGKGRALKACFRESVADIIVFMDVDLAVSLENIPKLLQPILNNNSDLVIGSRLLPDSNTERSFFRGLSSKIYNMMSRIILGHKFSDLQCGFKAINRQMFGRVESFFQDDNWFFDTELVILMKKFQYRITEIPVDWKENRYDTRKSRVKILSDSWGFIVNLFLLKKRLKKIK